MNSATVSMGLRAVVVQEIELDKKPMGKITGSLTNLVNDIKTLCFE